MSNGWINTVDDGAGGMFSSKMKCLSEKIHSGDKYVIVIWARELETNNDVTYLKRIPKLLICFGFLEYVLSGRKVEATKQLTGSDDENAAQDKA